MVIPLLASAFDFEVDGICYKITSSVESVVAVTYYSAEESDNSCKYIGAIEIPSTVDYDSTTYSVAAIGRFAFHYCNSLNSVIIPESVTSIGWGAFEGCIGLTTVAMPKCLMSMESSIFKGCSNLTYIDIPEGIVSVGSESFEGCSSLISISIPESVTSIERSAFEGCSSLTSIIIPEGVTSIGSYAFNGCSSLASITIPEGVRSIENSTFRGCNSLSSIIIPKGLTSVGYYAFEGCSSLASITIPEGVTSIGSNAFTDCSGELFVNCNVPSKAFVGSRFSKVTIGEDVTSVGEESFYNCTQLHSVIIGSGVLTIGSDAFYGTPKEKVSWLTNVPPSGYRYADGLINYVGNSQYLDLTNTKEYPYISSLFEVDGVTYVPNPTNMTCDVIDCRYSNIGAQIRIDSIVTYRGKQLQVGTVMPYTFYKNDCVQSIKIDCNGDVAYGVFYGCKNLTSLFLGDNVLNVGEDAFYNCKHLEFFEIGRSLKNIGSNAFYGCRDIKSVTCHAKQPPLCGSMALDDIDKWTCTLNVPMKAVERYQTANQWESFFFVEGFQVEENVVTFVVDGETYGTVGVEYGEEIFLLDVPQKEGYTFSGWKDVPEVMPANDVTISGTFTVNKYLVTFKIGDEVIAVDSLEYGATIVAPEAPEKEGYAFDGWGEVAEAVPANDVTYEGTYTVNIYKVYYYVGEELVHTAEVAYGEAIPEYVYEPTEEGYTFLGWVGETYETMPAHDVTYVANIDNGIDAVSTDNGQQSTVIYDLMGRKVLDTENLKGGIYIVNGRKVIVNN